MRQRLLRLFAPQALGPARPPLDCRRTMPVACPHCGMVLAVMAQRLPVVTPSTR